MSTFTKFRDTTVGLIAAIAPTLATSLGGPLAGMAVSAISKAVLGKDAGSIAEIETALSGATPETLAAIRKADQEFEIEMGRQGIDLEKINADDRGSARNRQIALRDHTPTILAVFVTLGFFGVLGYLLKYGVPAAGGEALLVMLGALGAAWGQVIAYYFGSSAGSAKKTELLGRAK